MVNLERMAMEPNAQHKEEIVDLGTLLSFCEMPNIVPEGSDDNYVTATMGFMVWFEAAPTTHNRGLATLTTDDFAEELRTWRVNGAVPSIRARTAAKLAHITARRLCLLEAWPTASNTSDDHALEAPDSNFLEATQGSITISQESTRTRIRTAQHNIKNSELSYQRRARNIIAKCIITSAMNR